MCELILGPGRRIVYTLIPDAVQYMVQVSAQRI